MESHSSSAYNSLQNTVSESSFFHHIKNDITGTCADLVCTGSDEETYSRARSGSENSLTMNDSSSTKTDDQTDDHEDEYAAAEDKENDCMYDAACTPISTRSDILKSKRKIDDRSKRRGGKSRKDAAREILDARRKETARKIVDVRVSVQKEITVMTIGSKSKAYMLVKGPPKFPYSVSDMVGNKGLERKKASQRYRIQEPRTGGLFHRIKPRPVMMDTSKFPVKSVKNRPCKLQDRIPDNFHGRIMPSLEEDSVSCLTDIIPPQNVIQDKSLKQSKFNKNKMDSGKSSFQGNKMQTVEEQLDEDDDTQTSKPKPKWRKPVPDYAVLSPKECIDVYEVALVEDITYTDEILPPSASRKFFKSRSKLKERNVTFDVTAEESEIDQIDAGKPLSPYELKRILDSRLDSRLGNKVLGKTMTRNKTGLIGALRKCGSGDTNTSHSSRLKGKSAELEINADGTILNEKIVYSTFGGVATETMALIKIDEDIVPMPESTKVLVQIETCTVSKMDAKIRHGEVGLPVSTTNDNITPGTEIVGNVRKCGDAAIAMYGINEGDTVASLVGCGGNAKYINLDAGQLVRVPRGVAAISAAIVIESYLPAFQALLLRVPKTHRYTLSALNGKGVLIFGGITTVGQALIELSLLLGASEVYTTATIKHHELLESFGAIPLELDPESWPQDINEQIDIAVDPSNFAVDKTSLKAMSQDGKLVCFGTEKNAVKSLFSTFSDLFDSKNMKTHMYNVFDEWKVDLEGSKNDLSYLFGLLKLKRIDPQLAGTLRLNKIPEAHTFLDGKRRIQGTFVCLPFAED